ncbi:hypothetical protein [Selenomonas ruminantium]|uniref:hypothetical protein n=1 Tax=Selenomonas ruminantium TaxID=971 RepID=UPI0026EF578E|nr:hypothetical protein [Selenomonas ruminantium]
MKKKIMMAIMTVLMLAPSFCYANIPDDKAKHIGVAAGLDLGMEALGVKETTRNCILGALFVGKEIYDHNKHPATHDHFGDLAADVGGVMLSRGTIWIIHRTF